MKDDVYKYIYGMVVVFLFGLLAFFAIVYVSSCGFTLTCNQAQPILARTPIPTVGHAANPQLVNADNAGKCRVAAVDLMGAWVSAGASETEAFLFTDINGSPCEGNYANDIRPLFVEANIWADGSVSCANCHNADFAKTSAAKLDLGSYAGIKAGSQRADESAQGTDILGAGNWKSSLLYQFTVAKPVTSTGHADATMASPIVYAGKPSVTATP